MNQTPCKTKLWGKGSFPRLGGGWIACLCSAFLLALPVSADAAKAKSSKQPTRADVAEKKTDLKELRTQIESLQKEMANSESKRAGAVDKLKNVEQEISVTQRELHNLSRQRGKLQTTLKNLGNQSQDLEGRIERLRAQLENLLYHQYLRGSSDSLRLLFNGENPNQLTRDLYYLSAVSRFHSQLLGETEMLLDQKKTLAEDTRERADELSGVENRQKEQHGKLVAQREQRKAVLNKISAEISEQRKEIGNLRRDEKQLSQLIERLSKIIAARPVPRKDSGSRTQAQGKSQADRQGAPELANENTPDAVPAGAFSSLKGRLRLPVKGVVTNRFGGTRQEGSTWKGLFIRAQAGSDIKAIAAGRVVFADWMRGFGNLLILDHGGNYLSIYGNNDALFKQVGDNVRGGDSVAAVGNSGGNPESGLYFELRHQGQPIDPMRWVSLK